jgi:hypothetical protein
MASGLAGAKIHVMSYNPQTQEACALVSGIVKKTLKPSGKYKKQKYKKTGVLCGTKNEVFSSELRRRLSLDWPEMK